MNTSEREEMSRWLITGGCGFIGSSLISPILKDEPPKLIRVLDNLSVGARDDLAQVCEFVELEVSQIGKSDQSTTGSCRVELIVGDIRDAAMCEACCQGIDVVVHLAASTGVGPSVEDPRFDMDCNVVGTLNMLEGARTQGVKRFVFASSGAPVGEVEPPIHEDLAPRPVSPYGASKLAGEGYCSAYFRSFGLETVALRFSNVYGPGSTHKNSVVAKFIKQALAGETLEIYGDGNQTRDFIFIDDLVRAVRLAATTPEIGGQIFQIATAAETTVAELTEKLISVLKKHDIIDINVIHGEFRTGDVRRNFSDTTKARHLLGWQADVGLLEGLNLSVRYFV